MVIELRTADERDTSFLVRADPHVNPNELQRIVAAGRVTLAVEDMTVLGWLRWGLFWDEVPFMNMIFVPKPYRGLGIGTLLIENWENEREADGHTSVMTSTQSSERAQHLFRRLGYVDCGGLLLPGEPLEILLSKPL